MDVSSRFQHRFLLQRDSYSCGAVAIHNAHVWRKGTASPWDQITRDCQATEANGTYSEYISIGISTVKSTNVSRIKQWLDHGHGIILLYCDSHHKSDAHYVFAHKDKHNIKVYNMMSYGKNPDYMHRLVNWAQFESRCLQPHSNVLENGFDQIYPLAWRIVKLK